VGSGGQSMAKESKRIGKKNRGQQRNGPSKAEALRGTEEGEKTELGSLSGVG